MVYNKIFILYLTVVFLVGFVSAEDPQLNIEIANDKSYVVLENSQIYVKYLSYVDNHEQFSIKELRIKSANNENQVGTGLYNYIEADAGRGTLSDASIIYDGTDRKTVRLIWNNKDDPLKKITHEVSIYPHSRHLKIDYINVQHGLNIVDLGQPGGTNSGIHVAYGHSGWGRDYITHTNPSYHGSYYNRYPPDGVNDPADGGSLNYNDHFIVGVYNSANGRGFARAMPVAATHVLKLLLEPNIRRGLELFPYPFYIPHPSFTGYLYVVTDGESEILSVGKILADGDMPGSDKFSFTAHEFNLEEPANWVRVGDMDNDGDQDIATGTLILFLNNGGGGWTRVDIIETESNGESLEDYELLDENGAFLHDVDGDGDLDLLKSKRYQDPGWVENPGTGSPRTIPDNEQWKWYRLATGFDEGGGTYHKWWDNPPKYGWFNHDLEAYDLDSDGKAEEFVHLFQGAYINHYYQVHWFSPGASPKSLWESHTILPKTSMAGHHNQAGLSDSGAAYSAGDMDNDGDLDFALSNGWAENPGGDATGQWTWHQVSPDSILNGDGKSKISQYIDQGLYMGVSNTLFGDMDKDSDLDIVMSWGHHGYGIHWFENTGNPKNSASWTGHWVDSDLLCPEGLQLYDMDADSDLDIVAADLNFGNPPDNIPGEWTDDIHSVYIFENLGGNPLEFEKHIVYTGNPLHSFKLYDINQDGRMDIIGDGQADQTITYLENTGSSSGCTSDPECDYMDNLPCVDGYCDEGTCRTQFTTSSCNDGITCTENDHCSNGICSGTPNDGLCTERPECETAICTASGCEYTGCPPLSDMVLWLPFDGNYNDISGNGNNMACSSCPTSASGKKDGAYQFSGTQWLRRADPNLDGAVPGKSSGSPDDFTITAWVRLDSLTDRKPIVSKQGGDISGNKRGFLFTATDSEPKPSMEVFKDESSSTVLLANTGLSTNTWYHLAVTYDYVTDGTSRIRLYIDGDLDASANNAVGPVQGNPQDLDIGRYYYNSGYSRYMDGYIDDLRIYSRALSATEIAEIYSGCVHEADKPPCDGCVDMDELLDYIAIWQADEVPIADLMGAIAIWKDCS